jgi:hypothetical protein
MDETELQAQVVERLLTAQRAFLMALKLIFEGDESEFQTMTRTEFFEQNWGQALFCNGAISETLGLHPETIDQIQENIDNGIILDHQMAVVGDLETMYGSSDDTDPVS